MGGRIDGLNYGLYKQERVHRSTRVWTLYLDLEESLGTLETTKAAYDRCIELKVRLSVGVWCGGWMGGCVGGVLMVYTKHNQTTTGGDAADDPQLRQLPGGALLLRGPCHVSVCVWV